MRRLVGLISLAACSGAPPCNAAFQWTSGVAQGGACELTLSHGSASISFEVPPLASSTCPATTSVPCGPAGVTCTRTCDALSIVADDAASREIVGALGTSNVDSVLRCGVLGHVAADVIIETSSANLQECVP
jgi:hypothetical protein